jgi:hypothetical protein
MCEEKKDCVNILKKNKKGKKLLQMVTDIKKK